MAPNRVSWWLAGGLVVIVAAGVATARWPWVSRTSTAENAAPRSAALQTPSLPTAKSEKSAAAKNQFTSNKARLAERGSRQPVIARRPVNRKPHTAPPKVLARLLHRLHYDALQHFYADPRNGMRRVPVVYERVVRQWTVPTFSPGELGTSETIPFDGDLKKIHATSLQEYLNPKPLPKVAEINPFKSIKGWNQKYFEAWLKKNKEKKTWEAKNVDLIGLLLRKEPVAYVSEKIPEMDKLGKAPTRPLDDFEYSGLSVLQDGHDLYARSHNGVIRLLGAVRAKQSCLSCHTKKKEGDLLGAFSYTLREAKYEAKARFFPRRRRVPAERTLLQRLKAGKNTSAGKK